MERQKSSVFAPSFTRIASGRSLTLSRMTDSAVWKVIGFVSFARVSAIFVRVLSLRSAIAPVHSAGGLDQPEPMAAFIAAMHEPMSPITGAAVATLLSASTGEMSTWMYCVLPASFDEAAPQVLPLPCDSSQFRRAPTSITTSASASTYERAADADCGGLSGSGPLALD